MFLNRRVSFAARVMQKKMANLEKTWTTIGSYLYSFEIAGYIPDKESLTCRNASLFFPRS